MTYNQQSKGSAGGLLGGLLILIMFGCALWVAFSGSEEKPKAESAPYREKIGFKYIGPGVHAEEKVQLCATAPTGEIRALVKFHPKHGEVSRKFGGHSAKEGGLELPADSGCMYYTAPPLEGKKVRFDQVELTVEGEEVAKANLPIFPKKLEPNSSSLIS